MENYIISFWSGLQFHRIFVYEIQHLRSGHINITHGPVGVIQRAGLISKTKIYNCFQSHWNEQIKMSSLFINKMICNVRYWPRNFGPHSCNMSATVTNCKSCCNKGLIKKKVGGFKESPWWQFTEVRTQHVSVLCILLFFCAHKWKENSVNTVIRTSSQVPAIQYRDVPKWH
jgi:hypothetical protein